MSRLVSASGSVAPHDRVAPAAESSVEVVASARRQQRVHDRPARTIVQSANSCEIVRASHPSSAQAGQTLVLSSAADLNEERAAARIPERNNSHLVVSAALTSRQRDILVALERWVDARGWPPSVEELRKMVRLSKATVAQHLDALERKDYIRRGAAGEHRGLRVLIPSVDAKVVEPKPIAKTHYCERCDCDDCRRLSRRKAMGDR